MINFIQFLNEAIKEGTLDEYYDTILKTYKSRFINADDAETFIEFLKMNDENMMDMFGSDKLNIEKEDNGTLIIAYFENDSVIALIGIVSTKDKMTKYDIGAINMWIDKLIEKMKEGKIFMTHERHRKKQYAIYIPEEWTPIYEIALSESQNNGIGIGLFLLSFWAVKNGLPVPEIKSRKKIKNPTL